MGRTFTKFTTDPSGRLVYKSNGKAAPSGYEVRGYNVYKDGRKIGTVSGRLTKTEQAKVDRAYRSRRKRAAAQGRRMQQGKPAKPRKPSKKAPRRDPKTVPSAEVRDTEFPEPSEEAKDLLFERVKEAAKAIARAEWMKNYINRMDPEILWEMWLAGEYTLETYFQYYEGEAYNSKKPDYARHFIKVYQAYAGVKGL